MDQCALEILARIEARAGEIAAATAGDLASYREAHRALRHASSTRPLVFGSDVRLFDELTASRGDDAARLIPERTRQLLGDSALRATVEAYFAADLNVAAAARALSLHPNSLRYRLSRIAEITGRNPRKLADLLELVAAARLISAPAAADRRPRPASRLVSAGRMVADSGVRVCVRGGNPGRSGRVIVAGMGK